ncbi:MAG: DUF4369 domain-containing protein [Prevotella sp.]
MKSCNNLKSIISTPIAHAMGCFVFCIFFLCSCSENDGRFRIKGQFRHLNQAQFYIYSEGAAMNGIDTIKVQSGRFTYEKEVRTPQTMILIFPNFTEQPVFVVPGKEITIVGDASHLKEMEIKGTEENEQMTAFRLHANTLTPPETNEAVKKFVDEHPQSSVSLYLIRKYFINTLPSDYVTATLLLKKMKRVLDVRRKQLASEKKEDLSVTTLSTAVNELLPKITGMKTLAKGTLLPSFGVKDINGNRVNNVSMKNKVSIISVWASWYYTSEQVQRRLRYLKREYGDRLYLLSVCIDANDKDCRRFATADTVKWAHVCTGEMWDTPLLQTMGLQTVSSNIVLDTKGKVVATNLNEKDLESTVKRLLKTDQNKNTVKK